MKCNSCGSKISKKFKLCPYFGKENVIEKQQIDKKKLKKKNLINFLVIFFILIGGLILLNKGENIANIRKSVVKINVYDKSGEVIQTGSGFVAFQKNILITNAHVITGGNTVDAITEENERLYINGGIYYNQDEDVAILKLNAQNNIKPLKISSSYKVGDKVIAIGSPLGIKNSVSDGMLSNILEDKTIQHTASMSHGSSGGPLFNSKGKVIGMNTETYTDGQNINLSIPIEKIEKAYQSSKNNNCKTIKQIQLNDDKYIQSVILNNKSGKKIIELIKKETKERLNIRNDINDLKNIPYLDIIYENKDLFSDVLIVWGRDEIKESDDATERELIKETTVPEIIILKRNSENSENTSVIKEIFKNRADFGYKVEKGCFFYCQSSTYMNALKNPKIGLYKNYAYMIISTNDDFINKLEKLIKQLP